MGSVGFNDITPVSVVSSAWTCPARLPLHRLSLSVWEHLMHLFLRMSKVALHLITCLQCGH